LGPLRSNHSAEQPLSAWSAGAWFGSVVGSTLWLLVSAVVLSAKSFPLAALVFALFLLPNLVGLFLWRFRRRISMLAADLFFLLVFWACGMAAILAIDRAGYWRELAVGTENRIPASSARWMLTVLVAVAAAMAALRRRKRSTGTRPGE
jgi:hypothetical protein